MKTYRVFRKCPHCKRSHPWYTKHIEHCREAKDRRTQGNQERREAIEGSTQ